jgi:hypothetical protein
VLRKAVLPLTKERIVNIYFTTNRSLHFESFDSTGSLLKSLSAFENLSSFPISYGYGQHFLVCFSAKLSKTENNKFIRLYDYNLNLINSITKFSSIESIYMNNSNIFLVYDFKREACCEMYDYQLNLIYSFGQQLDDKSGFFMERSKFNLQDQNRIHSTNPVLFGYNAESIYLCNFNNMTIMSRKTGQIEKGLTLFGNRPYFLLDAESNIIKVNNLGKKINLYNKNLDILIKTKYWDTLDIVYLTKDNEIAFVDSEKNNVIFI